MSNEAGDLGERQDRSDAAVSSESELAQRAFVESWGRTSSASREGRWGPELRDLLARVSGAGYHPGASLTVRSRSWRQMSGQRGPTMKLIEYELNKWINVDHVVKLSYMVSQEVHAVQRKQPCKNRSRRHPKSSYPNMHCRLLW